MKFSGKKGKPNKEQILTACPARQKNQGALFFKG
jgi:hypothetical protein